MPAARSAVDASAAGDAGCGERFLAVVDYGAGNLRSVGGALDYLGAEWRLARTPDDLDAAAAVLLPGVGSAGSAMRELERRGFASALSALRAPLLGICLGLQLLFESSEEEGGVRCLGLLPGRVRRLDGAPRLPHMGWNLARPRTRRRELVGSDEHPILAGWRPEGEWFYFAHSYGCDCPAEVVLAETVYGPSFASAAGFQLVCGVQFHPEKSSVAGLRVLAAFLDRAGVQVAEAGGSIGEGA